MDYKLQIEDETVQVMVELNGENGFTAVTGGVEQKIRCTAVSEHHLHLSVDGRGYNVFVNDGPDGKTVMINGREYQVQDADELERKPSRKKGVGNKPTEVTPLTPSVVVSVLVKDGDVVEEGQKVVILSAMKMEVTLTAPHAGLVTGINAAEGDNVSPGQILVDIEKETNES